MTVYIVRYTNYFGEPGISAVFLNEERARQHAAKINDEYDFHAWVDDREVIE